VAVAVVIHLHFL